jgi:hypothetical protein
MTASQARLRVRQLAAVAVVASVVTPVFNVLTSAPTLGEAIQGVVDAVLISLLVGGYLIFLRDGWLRGWFGRLGFVAYLAVSSVSVLALFLVGRALGQVTTALDPGRFVKSFGDRHLVDALPFFAVVAVAVIVVLQMNRVIGTNVLRYFVAGVYHRPQLEERVFLFLDLVGSTQLAERLGSARYFELLRRFVAVRRAGSPRQGGARDRLRADRGPGAACMIPWRCRTP